MNYQQLLEIQIRYIETEASAAITVGAVAFSLGATAVAASVIEYIQDRYPDFTFFARALGLLAVSIGLVFICTGNHKKSTARIAAEASIANYQLIEFAKP